MSVHIMMIIETITLFRNMSERIEFQIPVGLHCSYKPRRSGFCGKIEITLISLEV